MTKKKRTKKRRYTKNPAPSRARRYGRRAAARVKSSILGLDIKGALMNTPYLLAGMLGTKWAAKRFGGGASEADPESWTWKSYLQGAIGAVATAFVANMVKRGSGKKVLEGGLALVAYDLIQNELIAGNEWASGQFGAADEYSYLPGDVESGPDGSVQMLGADYQWRELPEATMSGDVLQPPGRLGQLEPVTSLGETDAFRRAILG